MLPTAYLNNYKNNEVILPLLYAHDVLHLKNKGEFDINFAFFFKKNESFM